MDSKTLKNYYILAKPGIIYGNLLTTCAGFFLAAKGHIHIGLLLGILFGIGFVIGCGCIINNYTDRSLDEKMQRTKYRAFVTKAISVKAAAIYAGILGLLGAALLLIFTNFLTIFLGVIAFIFYIGFYAWGKRHSIHGTLIGAVSGALPPVAGYTAVTNHFDVEALLLFSILVLWQMPHFYAIAIYRIKDYTKATLPVFPVKMGIAQTKIQMVIYTTLFLFAIAFLSVFHFAGYVYLVGIEGIGLFWLYVIMQGFRRKDTEIWARKVFLFSLMVITVFSVIIPLDSIIRNGILFVW